LPNFDNLLEVSSLLNKPIYPS